MPELWGVNLLALQQSSLPNIALKGTRLSFTLAIFGIIMTTITKSAIREAIRRYNNGDRPFRFTKPRAWYLIVSVRAYPLKYIYALVINQMPNAIRCVTHRIC
jgi:hypothetical protein